MEKHSSSKGEGSPCASGSGFGSSEWLWPFGPVVPTAQQGRWISIPRHDGNGLQRSAGYGEIWPQRACNALQHAPLPTVSVCMGAWGTNLELDTDRCACPGWQCVFWCTAAMLYVNLSLYYEEEKCVCPAHYSEVMIWLTVILQIPIIKTKIQFATIRIIWSREQWKWNIIRQKTTTGCMFRNVF